MKNIKYFLVIILLAFMWALPQMGCGAPAAPKKPRICLNMIVKNESAVIQRCLESVKDYIDYWVILDTGSSDGTQDLIKNYLKDIPGELHQGVWKNFGESRSEAYALAQGKGEYILFMDADDYLQISNDFSLNLQHDQYLMWRGTEDFVYLKPQIVRGDLPWKWVGVTHEYIDLDQPYTQSILESVKYISGDGGARSKGVAKFLENIRLLKNGLTEEPQNSRYAFYLAESYRDAGKFGRALEWYQKRVNMGGWQEEVYWSLLQIGHMFTWMQFPNEVVVAAYERVLHYRPYRAEAPYYLAKVLNKMGLYAQAYTVLDNYQKLPKPERKDSLFNAKWIEDYGLQFEMSICSYYIGEIERCYELCLSLLDNKRLPADLRQLTERNIQYPMARLGIVDGFRP